MCGIFGIVSTGPVERDDLKRLAKAAQQRGRDSSGLVFWRDGTYAVHKADAPVTELLAKARIRAASVVMGHSRLVTNGLADNQPVIREDVCVLHNGIIVNHQELWGEIGASPTLEIDTELIPAIASAHLAAGGSIHSIAERVLGLCKGVVACAMVLPRQGKLLLFSNNGSLFVGQKGEALCFASEAYPLTSIDCDSISPEKNFYV
jgi:glucosamine--fructose-6-phosphate aminotransferase (isomerizing)